MSGFPGGFAEGVEKIVERRSRPGPGRGERLARGLTKGHLKGVGIVGDAAELLTAEEKGRAAAGVVGGRIGGALGALAPSAELVTVPAGAVAGSWVGQQLYDRYGRRISDAVTSELNTLGDQLGRELTHYAPYDLVDRLHRP